MKGISSDIKAITKAVRYIAGTGANNKFPSDYLGSHNKTLRKCWQKPIAKQEMGIYLNKLEWDWWMTGTFKEDYQPHAAIKAFYTWANTLAWVENVKISHFWALEGHKNRGVPHIHALIKIWGKDPNKIRRSFWWERWFDHYGRNRIEPYDPGRGVGYYLTKYIIKNAFDERGWDITYGKPRR